MTDLTNQMSEIERLMNLYELECVRFGAADYGNTDKLQIARKIVMTAIVEACSEYSLNKEGE